MKTKNSNPPKVGTKSYLAFQLLMRPQGATYNELKTVLGGSKPSHIARWVQTRLRNDSGYDVRTFKVVGMPARLRIVGRELWSGQYESYVDPKSFQSDLEAEWRTMPIEFKKFLTIGVDSPTGLA